MLKSILVVVLILFFTLFSCSSHLNSERNLKINEWLKSDRIKVLTSTCFIRDLIENIAGDKIAALEMIPMTCDPHSYQPSKVDLELLDSTQYLIIEGLNLEHKTFMEALSNHSKETLVLQDYLIKCCPKKLIKSESHGQYDPHIWMDLNLWQECGKSVLLFLEKIDSKNSTYYKDRAKSYFKDLNALDQQILSQYKQIPDNLKYLVSAHDAFAYYTKRYFINGKTDDEHRAISIWGLSPEASLSVKDLNVVLSFIKQYNIKVVFTEKNLSPRALLRLQDVQPNIHICLEPLYSDNFSEEVSSVETLLRYNTEVITKNLKSKGLSS